jgi:hypothetical protein
LAEVFPGVPLKDTIGENETLLNIDKAKRELGYAPRYSSKLARDTPNPLGMGRTKGSRNAPLPFTLLAKIGFCAMF